MHGLHGVIRAIPKPVIAMVNGYAIGGGHVLHVLCDLTIAADTAIFGQVGPRVGSVDPGFGTAYLARLVGEKKAREIWYLCRQYTAEQALAMGLVNAVVPAAELRAETEGWCREILEKSPTALKLAKQSFNADTEHIAGITELGFAALELYYADRRSEGRPARVPREAAAAVPRAARSDGAPRPHAAGADRRTGNARSRRRLIGIGEREASQRAIEARARTADAAIAAASPVRAWALAKILPQTAAYAERRAPQLAGLDARLVVGELAHEERPTADRGPHHERIAPGLHAALPFGDAPAGMLPRRVPSLHRRHPGERRCYR